jgi:hypothetical protein
MAMQSDLIQLCAVSERTARRWRACGTMPAKLAAWVAVSLGGDLGGVDAAWRGWCLKGGELYGPDLALGFKPGDVLAIPYVRALVKNYQREQRIERREPAQADFISGKYEPARERAPESATFAEPPPRRARG